MRQQKVRSRFGLAPLIIGRGKDIVMIALTGWGQADDRRKSEEAGFNGHLVKPVDYDQLLELLSSFMKDGHGQQKPLISTTSTVE